MDIYQALHQDHMEIIDLFKQIEEDQVGGDVSRYMLFANLSKGLSVHMQSEEDTLYLALGGIDQTHNMMAQSYKEHGTIRDALDRMANVPRGSEAWLSSLNDLQEMVSRHVEREESEVFEAARRVLTESEAQELSSRFEGERGSRMAA